MAVAATHSRRETAADSRLLRSSPVAWGHNRRNLRTASTSRIRSPARRRRSRRPTQRGTCSGTRLTPGGLAAAAPVMAVTADAL